MFDYRPTPMKSNVACAVSFNRVVHRSLHAFGASNDVLG